MNPLIELFDKLILEHGSAAIRQEHIEQLKRKAIEAETAHEKELKELRAAHSKEIDSLKQRHAEELANLERAIAELKNPRRTADPSLSEHEVNIVRCLACWEHGGGDKELSETLSIPLATTEFSLNNLRAIGFADTGSSAPGPGTIWHLTESGTAYAVKHNLVTGAPRPRYPQGFHRA